jgi:hypothetical protein
MVYLLHAESNVKCKGKHRRPKSSHQCALSQKQISWLSKILTPEDISKFIEEAADEKNLLNKVMNIHI